MTPTPLTENPRQEFLRFLKEHKINAKCGREYVLIAELQTWMTQGKPKTNFERLLEACRTETKTPQHHFSVDAETYTHGDKKRLLLISILIELDLGHLIHRLKGQKLVDSKLPIDLAGLQKVFKDDADVARQFNDAQWKYCPLHFEFQDEEEREPADRIVPICCKEKISQKGGSAVVYQISVQADFVSQRLKDAVASSRYHDRSYGPVSPPCTGMIAAHLLSVNNT